MTEQSNQTPPSTQTDGPRIYVACLAAYSETDQGKVRGTFLPPNGHLYGEWIEADQDADDIHAAITVMLKKSPIPHAEEFAIHDYEGFEGADIQEYTSIETVVKLAAFIGEHGVLGGKLLSNFHGDLEDAEAAYEHHAGEYKSLADFAQEIIEQSTKIPKNLVNCIDYTAIARDMELNGDVFTIKLDFESIHVFWTH